MNVLFDSVFSCSGYHAWATLPFMELIGWIFTFIAALLHGYFLVLEMFLWTAPSGRRVFHLSEEKAHSSKVLAANQGLYNGLLALGLLGTLAFPEVPGAMAIRLYCLSFIVIVGSYGAYSLHNIRVFFVQAVPALIALMAFAIQSLT